MSYFGKIVKNTAIMFAVGIALAAVAPTLISALGLGAAVTAPNILWNGVFFGGFGAFHAAIEPIINGLLGDRPRHTLEHKSVRSAPVITMGHAPTVAADIAPEVSESHFQDKVTANNVRVGQGSFADKVSADRASTQEQTL